MYCSNCNSPLFIWFYILCVMIVMQTQLLNAAQENCKDVWPNCKAYTTLCAKNDRVKTNCVKTCGLCSGTGSGRSGGTMQQKGGSATQHNKGGAAAKCKDKWDDCGSKPSNCRYSKPRRDCRKTCGFCEGGDWKKKALKLAYNPRAKDYRLEGFGLTSIPPKIPAQAKYVFLKDNKIRHITPPVHLKSLDTLEIPKNRIKDINAQTFKGLPKLRTLNLAENQISSIPANTFATLKNLYYLSLRKNQISSLPAGIFVQCPKIGDIFLQYNKLTSLSKDVFSEARLAPTAIQRKGISWANPPYVGLRGNPLVCDSTTRWIKTYAASKRLEIDIDPCSA